MSGRSSQADATLHELLRPGEIPCRSCPSKFPYPATHMASAKRINDLPPVEWPLCNEHTQWAIVAGWFPIRDLTEADFASAIEAATAGETSECPGDGCEGCAGCCSDGSTEGESATRQGDAQS